MKHGVLLVLQCGQHSRRPALSVCATHASQKRCPQSSGPVVLLPVVSHCQIRDGPLRRQQRLGRLLMDTNRDAACVVTGGEQEKYAMAEKSYSEQREGVYRVGDTRVSLDSIVYAFLEGHTAESIQQSFPLLTLEQVYGAITYYLAHRGDMDAYLQEQAAAFETLQETLRQNNPRMAQRIAELKHQRQTARP